VIESLPPQISNCPTNIIQYTSEDICSRVIFWNIPEAVDSCGQGGISLSAEFVPGDEFSVGLTTIIYEATDASGNTATCSFTIDIRDSIAPTIICPKDIIIAPDEGGCTATVDLDPPLVSDNCDDSPEVIGYVPTATFESGSSLIIYATSDAYGNFSSCSFNVTVFDNNAPVFAQCPDDLTVDTEVDTCGAFPTWEIPNATDDCDTDGVDIFADFQSGDFLPVGTTLVTYSAVDNVGNIGTCTFLVTVSENIAHLLITGCPE
jgi:hypothetical protein